MKSLMRLLGCMLADASIRCGTDTHRDYLTISRRIEHEGLSFLTIALPNFAKDFEKSLEQCCVDSTCFLGYKKRQSLPVFLRGLTSLVFNPDDGRLLDQPSIDAIFFVRQICLALKKVNLPCSLPRERKALDDFVKTDSDLQGHTQSIDDSDWKTFGFISDCLWAPLLSEMSRDIEEGKVVPKHGPGATAEKISSNKKYNLLTWHNRLETIFPISAFGVPTPDGDSGRLFESIQFREPGEEDPVRICLVPKTLKAPRIIAIEPVCTQYIQQGILEKLVCYLERYTLTSGRINFSDQTVNRSLALLGSKDGNLATIDLSEASDRVHKDVVYRMLSSCPLVRDAIFACRSSTAYLPDGRTVYLNKFASMGSALCFPIEAMVFFTLCILSRFKERNLRHTAANVRSCVNQLYVYGDDIIVPADEVPAIARDFKAFALKVNAHKTFRTGKFRESCGMDAYDGHNVTCVYVRCLPPDDRQNASSVASYVSLANQLYDAGLWKTAQHVRDLVETLLGTQLPHVRETAPCLGWISANGTYSIHGWSKDLHSPLVKSFVLKTIERHDPLEGYGALMKFFLKRGHTPSFEGHLERSVRPGSAAIKYQWSLPF